MSVEPSEAERASIAYLLTPRAIRERCGRILALAEEDRLEHLGLDLSRLDEVAARVEAVTRREYPDLDVPYHSRWRHFSVGSPEAGQARVARLEERLVGLDPAEQARARIDLAVTSVLLDAGAGERWRYAEPATGEVYGRSEGLAVASLDLFLSGAFSSDLQRPLQADARGLAAFTPATLAAGFQVREDNPLVGLEGRAGLIARLGEALSAAPGTFETQPAGPSVLRPGGLYDALARQTGGPELPAESILSLVLEGFGPIWPGRVSLGGVTLGDVWAHPALAADAAESAERGQPAAPGADLVPFHKLSQWLTYSLLEPLEAAGRMVTGLDALTGLPEYRNGGLLVDLGVLVPKHEGVLRDAHRPDSPLIVEWRALTVVLLDRLGERVRARLGLDERAFPLAKVLQGGTWTAGREVARERRADGGPPIRIDSDGTVF